MLRKTIKGAIQDDQGECIPPVYSCETVLENLILQILSWDTHKFVKHTDNVSSRITKKGEKTTAPWTEIQR
jgi:hypothetical protein